jgi:hypothetical protein
MPVFTQLMHLFSFWPPASDVGETHSLAPGIELAGSFPGRTEKTTKIRSPLPVSQPVFKPGTSLIWDRGTNLSAAVNFRGRDAALRKCKQKQGYAVQVFPYPPCDSPHYSTHCLEYNEGGRAGGHTVPCRPVVAANFRLSSYCISL